MTWKKTMLEIERRRIEGEFVKKLRRHLGGTYTIRVERDGESTHIYFDEKRPPLRFPKGSSRASE